MTKKTETRVLVLGAGLTGLTTAYYLKKKGVNVCVIDKQERAGGVIHTEASGGFVYEAGPNTGVLSHPETAELFEELKGLCELEIANAAAKYRWIWKGSQWEPLPSGLMDAIKTPLFTMKDKLGILGEPFRKKGTNPEETLAHLVRRRLGESFLNYAVDPFILGIYSGDPSYIVPKYALPKLYNLEQKYGSFIGGTLKKGFEKKDERSKLATREVFSVKGGLQTLVDALTVKIGPENILLNFSSASVAPHNKGYITRGFMGGEETEIYSDYVISTAGSYELPTILNFISDGEMLAVDNLPYARVVQATLGFNEWKGIPINAFGGLVPSIENRDILGVLFLSSFLSNRAPKGGALLSIFLGGIRKPHLVSLEDQQIRTLLEKELKSMMGLSTFNPDLVKLRRYSHAIPQYGANTPERLQAVERIQKKYPGLILGGNLRDGIGMSDRIKQGRELAALVNKG